VTPLDIDGKVLQDFGRKKGFDESTHISQEAGEIQGPR
jgi:hypothetical protein